MPGPRVGVDGDCGDCGCGAHDDTARSLSGEIAGGPETHDPFQDPVEQKKSKE